jgi:hypothetical protein
MYKNVFVPENKYIKSIIFSLFIINLFLGIKFLEKIYSITIIKKQHLFLCNFIYLFLGILFLIQKVYLKNSIPSFGVYFLYLFLSIDF